MHGIDKGLRVYARSADTRQETTGTSGKVVSLPEVMRVCVCMPYPTMTSQVYIYQHGPGDQWREDIQLHTAQLGVNAVR